MSGSTARKVQPFTISTKLSLPKCAADFSGDACPGIAFASALDSQRGLRRSLNERISLYLAQTRASPAAPGGQPRSPSDDGGTEEEQLTRSSLARSIKKITLSNWHGDAGAGDAGGPGDLARTGDQRNHNNNNSRPGKAQFKVSASPPLHPAFPRSSLQLPVPGEAAFGQGTPAAFSPRPPGSTRYRAPGQPLFLRPPPRTPLCRQTGGQEVFEGLPGAKISQKSFAPEPGCDRLSFRDACSNVRGVGNLLSRLPEGKPRPGERK